jgi:hypothetical protein
MPTVLVGVDAALEWIAALVDLPAGVGEEGGGGRAPRGRVRLCITCKRNTTGQKPVTLVDQLRKMRLTAELAEKRATALGVNAGRLIFVSVRVRAGLKATYALTCVPR